jgi:DnaJ-class molecular chaperone
MMCRVCDGKGLLEAPENTGDDRDIFYVCPGCQGTGRTSDQVGLDAHRDWLD